MKDINQQLDQYRRFTCTHLADRRSATAQGNAAQPLTAAQKSSVATKTDKGNKDQTLQWVFVGVGGAFAVAGGYLLYKGYLAAGGGHGDTKVPSNHGLRIFPTATASSRGIVAEFDF